MNARKHFLSAILFSVVLWVSPFAHVVQGQDIKYSTSTEVKMGGGAVVNFIARVAGATQKSTETTYYQGLRSRQDSDESTTIMDLDTGTLIFLNHKDRSYTKMTFGDIGQMAERGLESIEEARAEMEAEMDASDETYVKDQPEVDVRFSASLRRTGETKVINGVSADRVLLVMKAEAGPEMTDDEGNPVEGQFVVATEMWNSTTVDGYEAIQGFYQRAGDRMHQDLDVSGSSPLQAAFSSDPQMQTAIEELAERMEEIEGLTILSTTHFIAVPGGIEFDPDMAFREQERESPGVGATAAREAVGALARRFGRRSAPEPEPEPKPQISRFLTITTQIDEISTAALDPSTFEIPEGYAEVQMSHR